MKTEESRTFQACQRLWEGSSSTGNYTWTRTSCRSKRKSGGGRLGGQVEVLSEVGWRSPRAEE